MITPNKYMNLNNNILKSSTEVLKLLLKKKNKSVKYMALYKNLEKQYKEDTEYILTPSLNFLFLLGKIRYNLIDDTLELIL